MISVYTIDSEVRIGGRMTYPIQRIIISEMQQKDLKFLLELWKIPKVMKFADEFPSFRGWKKSDDLEVAWKKYQEKRRKLGKKYTQLIIRLEDGDPIGESFFSMSPKSRKYIGRWKKPTNSICLVGDIKLLPSYWGRGLGTEGMRQVVEFVFNNTTCEIFIVPPHENNPAAKRVYEKAGFEYIKAKSGKQIMWARHMLMWLTKERFKEIY